MSCGVYSASHTFNICNDAVRFVSAPFGNSFPVVHRLGLGIGGLWGLREGATRPLVVSNARLRLNSILNGVTRRRSFLGNSAGVLGRLFSVVAAPHCALFRQYDPFCSLYLTTFFVALIYNIVNSSIDSRRGSHDVSGGMAAGGLYGGVYKSTDMIL